MNEIKFTKKAIAVLEKCYSVCPATLRGTKGFLIATEKAGGCFFFDLEGRLVEQIWQDPGGVMSLVPVPGKQDQFLSTQEFYGPNDSLNARIVLAYLADEKWQVKTVAELPFVHRFDVLVTPEKNYLIACTLKSGHEYKEDWTHPGKIFIADLPDDLLAEDAKLELTVLTDGLTRNHGYYRCYENGRPFSLISAENGVFKVTPPSPEQPAWKFEELLDEACSDGTLIDLDGDGLPELLTFAPFHGDILRIWRLVDGRYELDYAHPEPVEFLHAIWSGQINGKPTILLGNRKGRRELLALTWDHEAKKYHFQLLDSDRGPANVTYFEQDGKRLIVATNRETNEVAMYALED